MSRIHAIARRYVATFLVMGTISCAYSADSEYSNIQDGVRMRVLNYDQATPTLRIENSGRETLAIQNDVSLGVSFYDGSNKVSALPNLRSSDGVKAREANSNQIAIIGPGACLEVPLRQIYFDIYQEGHGVVEDWEDGLKRIPPGKHSVRFTTNCKGITVLNVNFSPFKVNFNIPEFILAIKE